MKTETTPDAVPVESLKSSKLRRDLIRLCSEIREINETVTELEKDKAEKQKELSEIGKEYGLEKVRGRDWLLIKTTRTSRTIKPEKLLERGVGIDDIQYATETKESSYYQVKGTKAEEKP